MSTPDIAVIDYGVGNLLSVRRGFEHCGATVAVTSDPAVLRAAPRVVLPGVGAFAKAMEELRRRDLVSVVLDVAARGRPLMGICLGMQMLFDESEEFGCTAGLGLIAGRVVPIPGVTTRGAPQKVPHIGWNSLELPDGRRDWNGTTLRNHLPGEAVYFVHSFMASPADPAHRIADCLYGGQHVAAVVGRDNVVGCQFHPEKSGASGLKVLRAFLAATRT
ncbi:MAG: imidazole glycerol phosphate synthase subunit HisH [Proteobacteria bacterium]|nr:imidazole glycerol phosphate synthase subunit HisH [Pseudomonadota bacterium]